MLITGAVLLGTCGFVAGIIGIFHWRERVGLDVIHIQLNLLVTFCAQVVAYMQPS